MCIDLKLKFHTKPQKPKTGKLKTNVSRTNRGKSSEKKKVKQLLPCVKKRTGKYIDEHNQTYVPYTIKSFKEKFEQEYHELGGLGRMNK